MRKTTRNALATVAVAAAATFATAVPADAYAANQYLPNLVYRTGPYAPNGVPMANGFADYVKYVNAKGGINGVKIDFEECEMAYATDRGVECYERMKNNGPTGAPVFHPWSTGITFALTDKTATDKIPLITLGYGRGESADGTVFKWNFFLGGTYWVGTDILVQHIAEKHGGLDKLKGKKITLIYHDSPYGKEAIPVLEERSKMHGFELKLIPVTHPGVEQKAAWLQVRRDRPDAVILFGWGVMNSTAIKEAVATGFPREKLYGIWYSGGEPDVVPAGDGAKGYSALTLLAPGGKGKIHEEILATVHDKGQASGPREEVGQVYHTRGVIGAMLTVEAIRKAMSRYGNKPMTGEQVRWGLENLHIDEARIKELGFEGFMYPISTSCVDHMGVNRSQVMTWNGKSWDVNPKIYEADMQILRPMIRRVADAYAKEKGITPRDCAVESQQ